MKHLGEHKYYKYPMPSIANPDKYVWKCAIPGCTHILNNIHEIVGRFSLCHQEGCKEMRHMTVKDIHLKGKLTFCPEHYLMKLRPQSLRPFQPKVKVLDPSGTGNK